VWPRAAGFLPWLALALTAITGAAVATQAWTSAALAGVLVGVIVATMLAECGHAVAAALAAFEAVPVSEPAAVVEVGAEMPHVSSVAAMALEEA
jgi:predicted membrane protein